MRVRARSGFPSLVTDGRLHQGLAECEEYVVFGVSSEAYRLWDREGEPILYPKELFEVLDPIVPPGWVFRDCDEDDYRLSPELTSAPGFFEDYFGSDGDPAAQRQAREVVKKAMEQMRKALDAKHGVLIDLALRRAALSEGC